MTPWLGTLQRTNDVTIAIHCHWGPSTVTSVWRGRSNTASWTVFICLKQLLKIKVITFGWSPQEMFKKILKKKIHCFKKKSKSKHSLEAFREIYFSMLSELFCTWNLHLTVCPQAKANIYRTKISDYVSTIELGPVLFSLSKWLLEHSGVIKVCADIEGQKVSLVCAEETIKTMWGPFCLERKPAEVRVETASPCLPSSRCKRNKRAETWPLAQGSSVSSNPSLLHTFRSLMQTFSFPWACFLRAGSQQDEPRTFKPLEYPSGPVTANCSWFCRSLLWQAGKCPLHPFQILSLS